MKKNNPKKDNPEIKPIPTILPVSPPITKPEVKPPPEKNEPFQPSPEIQPNRNPEIVPERKNSDL